MARQATGRLALLAIHPEHASAILEGRKTVEFRKRGLAPEIRHVLLYATAPTKAVVGYFEIAAMDRGSPTSIWQRHGDRGAISRQFFRDYYSGAKTAVAIVVGSTKAYDAPVRLRDIDGGVAPPQSFAYLHGDAADIGQSKQPSPATARRTQSEHAARGEKMGPAGFAGGAGRRVAAARDIPEASRDRHPAR